MTLIPRTFLAIVSAVVLTFAAQAQWTFQYSYAQVTDSAADDYLFSLINAEIGLDPFTLSDQYLRPTSNLVDGLVTFRFNLGAEITAAHLDTQLNTEWSGTSSSQGGTGSIWGSKDGQNWSLLLNVPAPPSSETGTRDGIFESNLPGSLLGGNEIWIQARLRTVLDINDARFSPSDIPTFGNAFEFKAATVPEPASATLAVLGLLCLARRQRVRLLASHE
jgi:hypothetical protein